MTTLSCLIIDNSRFLLHRARKFCFENMYAIFRNVEIIGKINTTSEIYHKHKCLQTSIGVPSSELLLHISDVIPI